MSDSDVPLPFDEITYNAAANPKPAKMSHIQLGKLASIRVNSWFLKKSILYYKINPSP